MTTDNPCRIAFFSPKDLGFGSGRSSELMAASEVPTNMEVGLLAGGLSFVPSVADTIIRDGVTLAIQGIDKLAPNGQAVLYYVMVTA